MVSLSCKRNRPSYQIEKEIILEKPVQSVNDEKETIKNDIPEHKILRAKIIRILDGDTVEILYNQLPIKLRLEHIDAPEKRGKQPYGNKAKLILSDLCFGQMVKIHTEGGFDRNGRLIGVIYNYAGLNVNKEMVRLGLAWHFKKYSEDNSYDFLEQEARNGKIGLWQDKTPIAPWDYR
ncbi:MAG: micrococcal nuclease [Psychroserpens sp.]|jgi:micrococcal nuclease